MKDVKPTGEYLTGRQVCRLLGNISAPTLWRWRKRFADFPEPARINQTVNLWRREDIEAWLAERSRGNAA